MKVALVLLALIFAPLGPIFAEPAAVARTKAAIAAIDAANTSLSSAQDGDSQLAALTKATAAYEKALAALRAGQRDIVASESALLADLRGQSVQLSQLLAALIAIEQSRKATIALHPAGLLASAEAGLALETMTPILAQRSQALRQSLDDLVVLRQAHQSASDASKAGLVRLRWAQSELVAELNARQAAEGTQPATSPALAEALASLGASSQSLDVLVEGLRALDPPQVPLAESDVALEFGKLPLPVDGALVSRMAVNLADEASQGPALSGAEIRTQPQALVRAPFDATIRYLGPFLGYGNVIILEPSPDLLLVLAGLKTVYGANDQIVRAGDVVGQMGGENAAQAEGSQSETLYVELRRGGSPVDPKGWFQTEREEAE